MAAKILLRDEKIQKKQKCNNLSRIIFGCYDVASIIVNFLDNIFDMYNIASTCHALEKTCKQNKSIIHNCHISQKEYDLFNVLHMNILFPGSCEKYVHGYFSKYLYKLFDGQRCNKSNCIFVYDKRQYNLNPIKYIRLSAYITVYYHVLKHAHAIKYANCYIDQCDLNINYHMSRFYHCVFNNMLNNKQFYKKTNLYNLCQPDQNPGVRIFHDMKYNCKYITQGTIEIDEEKFQCELSNDIMYNIFNVLCDNEVCENYRLTINQHIEDNVSYVVHKVGINR